MSLVSHFMEVSYPSGQTMSCKGEGPVFLTIDETNVIVIYPHSEATFVIDGKTSHTRLGAELKETAMVLDPRAVIRLDGVEVYNPRFEQYYDGLEDNWKEWLEENPWWPGT